MTQRDSITYVKLTRICKKHLQWVGLPEAAKDILATLLVENYWSGEPLSPEDLSTIVGYSRGSISVALSQLRSLGFIESRIGMKNTGRGRRPTLFAVSEGLSGLVLFGVRRVGIEIEGILTELESLRSSTEPEDVEGQKALDLLEKEATTNAHKLREILRRISTRKPRPTDIDLTH
jgi:DNA-binding transcriptional regulator GbsR (MarR family)